MTDQREPDHPIIDSPWSYRLVEFVFRCNSKDETQSYIDLVLKRDETERRLRFFEPQRLKIMQGFPSNASIYILDIRQRWLERMSVFVGDFEDSAGACSFYAARVAIVDDACNIGSAGTF